MRKTKRKILPLIAILFLAVTATAQTTNGLSDAEIQGQKLAKQLCEMQPTGNSTNVGTLEIRDSKGEISKIPIKFETIVTATNWLGIFNAAVSFGETLTVDHADEEDNRYNCHWPNGKISSLVGNQTMFPFANSDFWICDLGLEFFHWPEQKIIKKEFARGRGCMVLESTNPNPSPNGYSKVDCWIDEESLGIVQAKAYDASGKLLKEFQPKSFKKVNGQWELKDMEIRNVQTGSRTRIEFDLNQNR